MRDHEAHPADDPGDRHARRGHERCRGNHRDAQPEHIDAERSRLVVGKREDVDAPAQQYQREESDPDERQRHRQVARHDAGETPQQPERDRGKLVVRIGDGLRECHARRKERAHHDAGEHKAQHAVVPAYPRGHREHRADDGDAAGEGQALHRGPRQSGEDACHRPQRAAARYAEDVGRDERIAEYVLIGRARRAKCRAHAEGRGDSRGADLEHDGARPVAHATVASGEDRPERGGDIARIHRKASHGKARRRQQCERDEARGECQRQVGTRDEHGGRARERMLKFEPIVPTHRMNPSPWHA